MTRPTGPKGRLAERSEVRERPLPTTGARSGDRRLAGGSKEGGDRVKQASQEPSLAAGGEPREVQLRGAAEKGGGMPRWGRRWCGGRVKARSAGSRSGCEAKPWVLALAHGWRASRGGV